MFIEIKIALNFILSFLYDKLPRRRVNLFGEELEKQLKIKLSKTNWIQNDSSNQLTTSLNELRCLNINKNDLFIDSNLLTSATESAMDIKEILSYLPGYLKIFIEPGLVAYLIEPIDLENSTQIEKSIKTLYKLPHIKLSDLNYQLCDSSLSSRESSESPVSSSSSSSTSSCSMANLIETPVSLYEKDISIPKSNSYFTPAEFAKTKFGSTKSKINFLPNPKSKPKTSNTQNTEFAAYIKQKLHQQSIKKTGLGDESYTYEPNMTANLLLSNLTKPSSFTTGFSGQMSPMFEHNSNGNFDFLVDSTIKQMFDDDDETRRNVFGFGGDLKFNN